MASSPHGRSRAVLPEGWPRPKGYSNGMIGEGRVLAVAGMIGWDDEEKLVSSEFLPQFRRALANVVSVVESAGGAASDIISLTLYVTDKREYTADLPAVGTIYRDLMGRHFPTMALVQVADLLEDGAKVEIQALATVPLGRNPPPTSFIMSDPDFRPLPRPVPKSFRYEERDRVGIITLDRPDKYNALTFEVYRELTDFFGQIDRRSLDPHGARALVLRGEGKAFCSGGDVDDIITRLFARDTEGLLRFTRMTGELIASMRKCQLPIVATIRKVAAGAGAVMALASDLRVMETKSFFAFLFPQVGLSGADMGASWLLPRLVGLGHASEILMLGDRVYAERCAEIGLANRVVTAEALDEEAFTLARKLAAGPHFGLRMTKNMLQRELDMRFDDAIEAEAQAQTLCMEHPDFREANDAWMEKRDPNWR